MIPVLVFVRWRRPGGRSYSLWLPLFLVWLILLPVLLVLLPFVVLVLALARARPFGSIAAVWGVLIALTGTEIELDSRNGAFVIRII